MASDRSIRSHRDLAGRFFVRGATTMGDAGGEVFLEFQPHGHLVKVVAIDAKTGIEVSVFGPASTARSDLQRIALRKLKLRLEREG